MRRIAIVISFIFITFVSSGQQVVGSVDSTTVQLGTKVGYYIKVSGENLSNPEVDLTSLDTFDTFAVIATGAWRALEGNTGFVQELKVIPTQEGSIYIPKLKISFLSNGSKLSAYTRRINLDVLDNNSLPQDILSNKPIATEPLTLEDFLPYIIGLVLLLGLIGLWVYYKNKNKPEEMKIPEIIIPPHEIALTKLKKLKSSKIWETDTKTFHSKLSMILREYLGGRFKIHAVESTTGEIVDDMKAANMNKENIQQFKDIFEMADLVKFAKATPPKDIHDKILNFAEKFVQTTKPKIEQKETEN